MFQSYDYISLFMPFVNVAVSLGGPFQWIGSINDRFYLSRLNLARRVELDRAVSFCWLYNGENAAEPQTN